MNCTDALPLLEEYADGELAVASSARVAAHVEACDACAQAFEQLARERDFYLFNAPEVSPSRGFWSGIAARVTAEKQVSARASWANAGARMLDLFGVFRAPRLSPAVAAALVLVAVGLTVGVMRHLSLRDSERSVTNVARGGSGAGEAITSRSNANESSARTSLKNDEGVASNRGEKKSDDGDNKRDDAERAPTTNIVRARDKVAAAADGEVTRRAPTARSLLRREGTPDELVREAEQKYVAAIVLLARDARRRRQPRLDAETAARFERTLADVDRSIAETRRAARERPRDPLAAQYMLAAYAKKVDMLREMADY